MAIQTIRIGSMKDVHVYDDGIFPSGIDLSAGIEVGEDIHAVGDIDSDGTVSSAIAPVNPTDVVRLSDMATYGDVKGPATSSDNAIARFNGTNNKTIQGSSAYVTDGGDLLIPDSRYVGSSSCVDAVQIEIDGDVVMKKDLKVTEAFGCNNKAVQASATVNIACTDLATVIALCNQIRTALIADGICV